jgi:hypothetical protein
MEQFIIMLQNHNGFSITGPLTRAEVESKLAEATEDGLQIYTEMPEFMGGEMVEEGICVLSATLCTPKAKQVVIKYEF